MNNIMYTVIRKIKPWEENNNVTTMAEMYQADIQDSHIGLKAKGIVSLKQSW